MDRRAAGLSPLRPELSAIAAGRLFLKELDRLAGRRNDFAFESTLSGVANTSRLNNWKNVGCRIEIIYLKLAAPRIGLGHGPGRAGTTCGHRM